MVLKNKNAGIFKVKVEVGDYFYENDSVSGDQLEKEKLEHVGDYYVVLREPTAEEALSFKEISNKKDETVDEKKMFAMIPGMIVEHNFESEAGKKMSTDEVWKYIMQRSSCATEVITKWSTNIPLANRKLGK